MPLTFTDSKGNEHSIPLSDDNLQLLRDIAEGCDHCGTWFHCRKESAK